MQCSVADRLQLTAAFVGDLNLFGDHCGGPTWAHVDGRAVEANAHGRAGIVEAAVVAARGDDVVHGVARNGARHETAHQQPGDRGVAIGEVKNVGLCLAVLELPLSRRLLFQVEAFEAGVRHGAVVVARLVAIESGNGVDADANRSLV